MRHSTSTPRMNACRNAAPRDRLAFREREDRGSDRPARMDHRLQMRVVEVERVRGDAVHERRLHDVQAVAAPEHGRLARPGKRRERRERAFHRLVAARADRAAEPVQDRARGLMPDRLRHSRASCSTTKRASVRVTSMAGDGAKSGTGDGVQATS